jgi:hypothetical protein
LLVVVAAQAVVVALVVYLLVITALRLGHRTQSRMALEVLWGR